MDTVRTEIRVSREWLDLVKRLPAAGRIVVVGCCDTGKTTLCRWLLSKLPSEAHPALVDADTGQSQVGPPGCVAWRFAGTNEHQFFFVGDTTPATAPATTLAATGRAVGAAEEQARSSCCWIPAAMCPGAGATSTRWPSWNCSVRRT